MNRMIKNVTVNMVKKPPRARETDMAEFIGSWVSPCIAPPSRYATRAFCPKVRNSPGRNAPASLIRTNSANINRENPAPNVR